MIGKTTTGGNVSGLLTYCYFENSKSNKKNQNIRGEYIFSQNIQVKTTQSGVLDISDISHQFLDVAKLNQNCKQYFWHQSFSFPIDENPSNDILEKIIMDFSLEFGFYERQLIAFRHYDKAHHHFHIIANRLDLDGKKAVSTSKNYARTSAFCRKMEEKYKLTRLESKKQNSIDENNQEFKNSYAIHLRKLIDENLPKIQSIDELEKLLGLKGIKVEKGRGITFILPDKKNRIKGSDLGKSYSLANLEKRIKQIFDDSKLSEFETSNLKRTISVALSDAKNFDDFRGKMMENNYQATVIRNKNKNELKFEINSSPHQYILGSSLGNAFEYEKIVGKLNENNLRNSEVNISMPNFTDLLKAAQATNEVDSDLSKINQSLNRTEPSVGIKLPKDKNKRRII